MAGLRIALWVVWCKLSHISEIICITRCGIEPRRSIQPPGIDNLTHNGDRRPGDAILLLIQSLLLHDLWRPTGEHCLVHGFHLFVMDRSHLRIKVGDNTFLAMACVWTHATCPYKGKLNFCSNYVVPTRQGGQTAVAYSKGQDSDLISGFISFNNFYFNGQMRRIKALTKVCKWCQPLN